MSPRDRDAALGRLVEEACGPANDHFAMAEARVRAFEQRYEITSALLLERLRNGAQKETAEGAEWLFWLAVLKLRAR
jgi:hypothetical protein